MEQKIAHTEHIKRLIDEIIHAQMATVALDENDLSEFIDDEISEVIGIESVVSSDSPNRMERLIEQIRADKNYDTRFNSVVLQLFYPSDSPFSMAELEPLHRWLNSIDTMNVLQVKWGIASQTDTQSMRVIVLCKRC